MESEEQTVLNEIELLKEKIQFRLPNVKVYLEDGNDPYYISLIFQEREIEIWWYSEEKHFQVIGLKLTREPASGKKYKDAVKLFDDIVTALDS